MDLLPADEFVVPPRSEIEVAADALWALLARGLVKMRDRDIALAAVGVGLDDLRCASLRAERRLFLVPPTSSPTAPAEPREYPPGYTPPKPRDISRAPAVPSATLATRTCRKCRQEKPTAEFPIKGGGLSWWCRPCSVEFSERIVRQNRERDEAVIAVRLHVGDACVGMACSRCGRELAVGQTMVVQAAPRHEDCPA